MKYSARKTGYPEGDSRFIGVPLCPFSGTVCAAWTWLERLNHALFRFSRSLHVLPAHLPSSLWSLNGSFCLQVFLHGMKNSLLGPLTKRAPLRLTGEFCFPLDFVSCRNICYHHGLLGLSGAAGQNLLSFTSGFWHFLFDLEAFCFCL